jgi:hypothetical protein
MKLRTFLLAAVMAKAAGCAETPPEPAMRSMTLQDVQTQLALRREGQALSTTDRTEIGRFSAYVTQSFKGMAAPIEFMRSKCPEKILSAKTHPFYGLESPDATTGATLAPDGIAREAKAPYTGEFVVVDIDGLLVSLFPKGVVGIGLNGESVVSPAKVLREVSAVAALAPHHR